MRAHTRTDPEAGSVLAVYQAFNHAIADRALAHRTFGGPHFSLSRMTWIKPSFFWMAYRCGWATRPNQERVLKIWLRRDAFERFLGQAALSHFDPASHDDEESWKAACRGSPVRVQWDPERSPALGPRAETRAVQIGLSGAAVRDYVDGAIAGIEDVTTEMRRFEVMSREQRLEEGAAIQAREQVVALAPELARRIGADPTPICT